MVVTLLIVAGKRRALYCSSIAVNDGRTRMPQFVLEVVQIEAVNLSLNQFDVARAIYGSQIVSNLYVTLTNRFALGRGCERVYMRICF